MAKLSKKEIASRVQKATVGFQIPINGSMGKLYDALETAVKEGKSPAELSAIVAASPGVVATA